jgi:hypothetical protein
LSFNKILPFQKKIKKYMQLHIYLKYEIYRYKKCYLNIFFINYDQTLSLINVRFDIFNTFPHVQYYWIWCVDINSGWSETIGSCYIRLVRWRTSLFINYSRTLSLTNVKLHFFNNNFLTIFSLILTL